MWNWLRLFLLILVWSSFCFSFFPISSHPASSPPLFFSSFNFVLSSSFEFIFFLLPFLHLLLLLAAFFFSFTFFRIILYIFLLNMHLLSVHSSISSLFSLLTILHSSSSTSFPLHSFLFLFLLHLQLHAFVVTTLDGLSCPAEAQSSVLPAFWSM
jgi:hypothetical protein